MNAQAGIKEAAPEAQAGVQKNAVSPGNKRNGDGLGETHGRRT